MMKKYQGLKRIGLKSMLVVLVVGMILMIWGGWAGATVTLTTDNLIVNPGAENGNAGWTFDACWGSAQNYVICEGKTLTAHGGSVLFACGDDDTNKNYRNSYAWQWIDVSQYTTNTGLVGSITLNFSGFVSNYNDDVTPILYFHTSTTTSEILKKQGDTYGSCYMIWKDFNVSVQVPTDTRWIKVLLWSYEPDGQNYHWMGFDDLKLTLTYVSKEAKIEVIEPADKKLDFGNFYVDTNGSTRKYNEAKKKVIKFKNTGDVPINWTIPETDPDITPHLWVQCSATEGNLGTSQTTSVELVPQIGGPMYLNNILKINNQDSQHGTAEVTITGTSCNTAKISYAWPGMGTNGRVNVGVNGSVNFGVTVSTPPSFPGAIVTGYGWKRSDKLSNDEISGLTAADFDTTTDPTKTYTFPDIGNHTVYAASFETVDNKKIVGELLEIPVRAWNLPKVNDAPSATTSWRNDKYIGVRGQAVYLKATGITNNGDSSENVANFIWDFNNDWNSIELNQTAGQEASYTWNTSQLNGRIKCKAVTNYGIQSEEKLFDLKIYETLKVDSQGPYTGRPEKPVKLKCSFNQTSYPGATYNYQWYVVDGYEKSVSTNERGEAEYTWKKAGQYTIKAKVTVTTEEGLILTAEKSSYVTIEAGKPTAMPGGPYKGGIFGGNFSPIQFEGNHPDFVEDTDIGHIDTWKWSFEHGGIAEIWNPTRAYEKAGEYKATLKVRSEYGKWSDEKQAFIEVIDGKVAGFVRAADLRTPVGSVTLRLTSSHVDANVLRRIARDDPKNLTAIDIISDTDTGTVTGSSKVALIALTNNKGYYEFSHLPLGSYRILASKVEWDDAHEFEKNILTTELTLSGPNQLAIDFVDISVYPVGGRVVYSIQKNGQDVLVDGVEVKAQPISALSSIEANPSNKSLSATGVNYSMPLFAGQYLFLAKKPGHDVRIKENTPDYNPTTQLVTIKNARTDIDFIDYLTYKLTVFVEDSGGYKISSQTVTISGDNGQAEGISDAADGKFVATLNPGKYTVKVQGALPEEKEVDITYGDNSISMTIPTKIELEISEGPKLFGAGTAGAEFLKAFGLGPNDNPEGYMYYYAPGPITHAYVIKATSNGHPVKDFNLFIWDEVSMETSDPPEIKEEFVSGVEGSYTMTAGLPKKDYLEGTTTPQAGTKTIRFWATKDKYLDSDKKEDGIVVLGDVAEGSAAKIVSIPTVNYTVLHDPPGDGSYSFIDDSMTIKGIVEGMQIKINDTEIPVYPSPWRNERKVENFAFESNPGSNTKFKDIESKGLLGYKNSDPVSWHFIWMAALEGVSGALVAGLGPAGFIMQLIKMPITTLAIAVGGDGLNTGLIQYEVSPNRHLETPSGDELPDLLGPGKGDIYYGEGWTLGLQTKYRLGIKYVGTNTSGNARWALTTNKIETYDILERTNQYLYTTRDIENIVNDLGKTAKYIGTDTTHQDEKKKLEESKKTWQNLLDNNLAYVWNKDYLGSETVNFESFLKDKGSELKDKNSETLIFSAGPTFEYSRSISTGYFVNLSQNVGISTSGKVGDELEMDKTWVPLVGSPVGWKFKLGGELSIDTGVALGTGWESGQSTSQSVGFVLNDDDVGDNYCTRVYADPRWGTPIFFQDAGSISSDPWEKGTNRAVDITMELLKDIEGKFDYHDGAHYKVKLTYTGQRQLESSGINFLLYDQAATNKDNLTIRFNGNEGPYGVELSKESPVANVVVSIYPPEIDQDNSEEKKYWVTLVVSEEADDQVAREMTLPVAFVDMRVPRTIITAPYPGERVSPVFFPTKNPFDIEVVSEDMDIAKIQLQIRGKQPDGVWEPWRNLSGMKWEGTNTDAVTLFEYLDRVPPRREFTFKWTEGEIKQLGVGEYALQAIATDKATKPNTDIDPPNVVFLVDESKPSVLTSIPDYQARESERIYRGELSVLFTDDMRSTDFSDRTVVVMDLLDNNKIVAGYVSYTPAIRKVTFVPIVPFRSNGFYRAQVKTDEEKADGTIDRGVHDLAGNPLDNAFMWTFRTTDVPFEPIWSVILSATDGINKDGNNIAAVAYGALDGEDEKDARAVPSLATQLRLSFLNRQKIEFDRDTRSADGRLSHHWFFVVSNAQYGATVTLKWQPSLKLTKSDRHYQNIQLVEFDKNGNVINVVKLDPTKAEMNNDTAEIIPLVAYTYTNKGEDCRYFRLDVQKIGFVAETFRKGASGWKFFSVPIIPQVAEPFVNLGDDMDSFRLYQYETGLGGYKIYPFDIGGVSLQTGHGYFTRIEQNVEVDVGGAMNYNEVKLALDDKGWHAIGNPFILPVNVADLQIQNGTTSIMWFSQAVTNGLIEATLYRWNVGITTDSYVAVTKNDKLDPWGGYWLRTKKQDIKLIIPAPVGVATAMPTMPDWLKPPMFAPSMMPMEEDTPSQFSLGLELFLQGSSDLATMLGTHKDARTGADTLDSMEPPIMAQTVAAYFNHTDWNEDSGLYNCDYQPCLEAGQERTWQLVVYTDQPNSPLSLSWEKTIDSVPTDIVLSFRKIGETKWQDMRQVRKVEFSSSPLLITRLGFDIRVKKLGISPPSGVQVVAKGRQVMLCWEPNDNPNIKGYTIIRRDEKGETVQYQIDKANVSPFMDTAVCVDTTYTYQVAVCSIDGTQLNSEQFTVKMQPFAGETVLLPCYPNPSTGEVQIPYKLAEDTEVRITIYNMAGELVRSIEPGIQPAGEHLGSNAAKWDGCAQSGERVASGIYVYLFKAGGYTATGKIGMVR
ncbi:MAG: PKD domain-containing protein [Candidatus Desantisbacteria bacterium]